MDKEKKKKLNALQTLHVLAEAQEQKSNNKETVGSLKQDLCQGPFVCKPAGATRTRVDREPTAADLPARAPLPLQPPTGALAGTVPSFCSRQTT